MLKKLTVTNFALIDHAELEFSNGLNVLTGETGSGKSIIIDALNICLGFRASADFIRSGTEFLRVEAVFDIDDNEELIAFLCEQGLILEEDKLLIISRRINKAGKNTIVANGCHLTLALLRKIGEYLVDMHGQHENQSLLKRESYFSLIDSFDTSIRKILDEYRQIYQLWIKTKEEIHSYQNNMQDRLQRLDMLRWQTQEIANANLKPNEDNVLEHEIKLMVNAEKVARSINRVCSLLKADNLGDFGVISALGEVRRELEKVLPYDASLQKQLDIVENCLYQLEDVNGDLIKYQDCLEFDPSLLEKYQDRMDLLYKLKKKYGSTIEEIMEYYQKSIDEIAQIDNYEDSLADLVKESEKQEKIMKDLINRITKLRTDTAKKIEKAVGRHLADLGMPKAIFEIKVTVVPDFNVNASNEIEMLFSANIGEAPRPLNKVASGGELSRIALAIKTVFAHCGAHTMVFDEIDSGIGGQTANMVAEKIAMLAQTRQVICITHLPQMAAMADEHIYIEKVSANDKTSTLVKVLTHEEQLMEITRMMFGNDISKVALDNAAQMIENCKLRKEKMIK